MLPPNRCFVPGFRQFSTHLTKCHACHGICTLSPLDAARTMRFAKNTQHDTSKVLRLPRKMTMGTSKVLRLPRKLQRIFWKCRKSIAPATQNNFRHVTKHVCMSQSATPATRNEATRSLKPPKMTTSAELTIGMAIWSWRGRLRTYTQRRANTPSTPRAPGPRVKREPLLRIRDKNWAFPDESHDKFKEHRSGINVAFERRLMHKVNQSYSFQGENSGSWGGLWRKRRTKRF